MTGPGTRLKQKLRWMGLAVSDDESCQTCAERCKLMDEWGPSGCRENFEIIVAWMREAAQMRGILFVEPSVRVLIWSCIRQAEQEERKNRKTRQP